MTKEKIKSHIRKLKIKRTKIINEIKYYCQVYDNRDEISRGSRAVLIADASHRLIKVQGKINTFQKGYDKLYGKEKR